MPILKNPVSGFDHDPLWYQKAVIYELHVRAFYDTNADGIGDFAGLTQKLDYLKDLGVSAIWLLPFYPSPLRDDGYDIADYTSINPIYGTLEDFKTFLREAHRRGLRVITELVVNHTSDQHPWFQKSRRAPPGSAWRNFYVWSDSPEKYKEARIIFKDFEHSNWTWDPIARAYYWHRFYSHQPDLNYANPEVHREILRALDFWFDLGVDGLRLDAVPYLYEREGTSCENLPETHAYLRQLRRHVDEKYGDRMLLGEANQWPEDAVAYFGGGAGDECHVAFHFPLMPRLFMAVRMEDRVPIVDILEQTPPIPPTSQWALFLRNHDELTLEMVTDEERDYMYRVYAHDIRARINLGIRRRLAPLLGNDRKRIELLNLLLFSMPGTPVIYYGDEIGMGDNTFLGDRNGVRTPMQWSSDKNAGFSRASPQGLYLPIIIDPEYHFETVNVEAQRQNPHSLFWWTKRVLSLRQRWKALGQGKIEFLHPANRKILAFVRRHEDESILVTANLSRFPQPFELDLSVYKDYLPLELFGRTEFPLITKKPYFLTMGPHSAYWFLLKPRVARLTQRGVDGPPELHVEETWRELLSPPGVDRLTAALPHYITPRRWFGAKGKEIKSVHVREVIEFAYEHDLAVLALLLVEYVQGDPDEYFLPLTCTQGETAARIERDMPQSIVARVSRTAGSEKWLLHDAMASKAFCRALLAAIERSQEFAGREGTLRAVPTPVLKALLGDAATPPEPFLSKAEQSNTSVIYGDKFILKFFRRLEPGPNPDLEISLFLSDRAFPHVPPLAGWFDYRRGRGEVISVSLMSGLVPEAKDAWPYTLDMLDRYFERVRTFPPTNPADHYSGEPLLTLASREVPSNVSAAIGTYCELARLLGQRTGELHLVLGGETENREFTPEPFTPFYQRSLYQSLRNLTVANMELLERRLDRLGPESQTAARNVLEAKPAILERLQIVREKPIQTVRIRCHGDYHLGQVLFNGKDFIIIDFEGEPARPLSERRIKRSPLRDVAGMIRSFDYATHAALLRQVELGNVEADNLVAFDPWGRLWHRWVSAIFLKAYLHAVHGSHLLPSDTASLGVLLDAFLLEKAVYEVGYELNNRQDWVKIPLQGILQLLNPGDKK